MATYRQHVDSHRSSLLASMVTKCVSCESLTTQLRRPWGSVIGLSPSHSLLVQYLYTKMLSNEWQSLASTRSSLLFNCFFSELLQYLQLTRSWQPWHLLNPLKGLHDGISAFFHTWKLPIASVKWLVTMQDGIRNAESRQVGRPSNIAKLA